MNLLAHAHATNAQAATPAPVTNASDADALAAHYVEVMDSLLDVIQQETELVRAGSLAQASVLEPKKTELSRLYVADTLRLRANRAQLAQIAPEVMPELVRRHNDFRTLLQINLTVLATAHAVSEGIVRGVSGELVRKSAPQTYGASGRANTPDPRAAQPLAVSRML
jgi:flagellar biosynthesis/type III secretory pathway chaperone